MATSRCLDALRAGRRRPLAASPPPAGLEAPEPTRLGELLWLEPYPDALLEGLADRDTGGWYTVGLMVLTLAGTQISALTRFDPGTLPWFGLPVTPAD